LKEIKAFVEATIDFPEEDIQFVENEKISLKLNEIITELKSLVSTYEEGRLIHDGTRVVIVGKPNVGKSSLLNRLLGTDRAIVHHEAGTTRDTIEETLNLGGYLFRLIDTAGIRESDCEIEKIGIGRAKKRLVEADLAVQLIDATSGFDENDRHVAEEIKKIKSITVLNKIDIGKKDFIKSDLKLSAKTGEGMDELKKRLIDFVESNSVTGSEGAILTNLRHKKKAEDGLLWLEKAKESADKKESAEFIAYNLDEAMRNLGLITGEITTEDVLNEIFSRFCLGK
jgi:tRNA modification GTPase